MTIEAIRKYHETRPFRPFTVVLADGTRIPVRHPEMLAHPGAGRTILIFEGPDAHHVVDLLLVTSLEVGVSRKRSGNGHRRAS